MCNILVVDDDHRFRPLLVRVLSEAGYHTIPAGTKLEAMTLIEDYTFDIVVIDANLPNGEGVAIAEKMDKELVKILLCDEQDHYDRDLLRSLGFTTVMEKPFSEEEFVSTVDKLVDEANIERRDKTTVKRDDSVIKRMESTKGRHVGESIDIHDIYVKTAVVSSRIADIHERIKAVERECKNKDLNYARTDAIVQSLSKLTELCPIRGEELKVLKEQVESQGRKWGRMTSILLTIINVVLTTAMAGILARMLGIISELAP